AYSAYIAARDAGRVIAALPAFAVGDGWRLRVGDGEEPWHPHYAGADSERLAHFVRGDVEVSVYAAIYGNQDARRELIAFGNTALAPARKWSWLNSDTRPVRIGGQTVDVRVYRARGPYGVIRDIWQVHWVGGRVVADDKWAKAHGALAKLLGGERAAGTLVLSAVRHEPHQSRAPALADFAAALEPVQAYFARALAMHAAAGAQ
ncbi:MAG: EpsI family protein, partial [Alphaproteobacteria bacterium]